MEVKIRRVKNFLFLHACILWYTVTSLLSKLASRYSFLSREYVICFVGIFIALGSYAILWQQAIKRFKPSVAYSNKSVSLIWTMLLSSILLGEKITVNNIIGSALIVLGVIMVAQDE